MTIDWIKNLFTILLRSLVKKTNKIKDSLVDLLAKK